MNWNVIAAYLHANWIEWGGFLTAVIGIWLSTLRRVSSWPVDLISDVLYWIVFYRANLQSSAWLQIAFIVFTFYGWWNWAHSKSHEGEVRVVPLATRGWIAGLAAGVLGSVLLTLWMQHTKADLAGPDATLAVFSLLATWWETRRHIASWWLWLAINVAYVCEYFYTRLYLTAGLYALLALLAVVGWRKWRRALAAQEA